jgi:phosphoglycolate phosphatase
VASPSSRSDSPSDARRGSQVRISVGTVLFDFDGTLVETALDFDRMRGEVLSLAARYGVSPPEGLHVLEAIAHARQQLTAREPHAAGTFVQEAEQILVDIEAEGAARARPLPGVEETLRSLREQGARVGIVTRNCRPAVEPILARFSLPHDVLLTRDDVARVKPDPAHLLEAACRLGSRPEWTLMVGDHPMDILAGRQAGMRTAAITFTRPAPDFADVYPDLVIGCIPDLLVHIAVTVT